MFKKVVIKGLLTGVAISALLPSAFAAAGSEGHGGDGACEDYIKSKIAPAILNWITADGAEIGKLDLSSSRYPGTNRPYSYLEYKAAMEEVIPGGSTGKVDQTKLRVKCVSPGDPGYPVTVHDVPKLCISSASQLDSTFNMTCDFNKFMGTSEQVQFKQIHHEFATNVDGLEPDGDDGSNSNFAISEPISGHAKYVQVPVLAVEQPRPSGDPLSVANYGILEVTGTPGFGQGSTFESVLCKTDASGKIVMSGCSGPVKSYSLNTEVNLYPGTYQITYDQTLAYVEVQNLSSTMIALSALPIDSPPQGVSIEFGAYWDPSSPSMQDLYLKALFVRTPQYGSAPFSLVATGPGGGKSITKPDEYLSAAYQYQRCKDHPPEVITKIKPVGGCDEDCKRDIESQIKFSQEDVARCKAYEEAAATNDYTKLNVLLSSFSGDPVSPFSDSANVSLTMTVSGVCFTSVSGGCVWIGNPSKSNAMFLSVLPGVYEFEYCNEQNVCEMRKGQVAH